MPTKSKRPSDQEEYADPRVDIEALLSAERSPRQTEIERKCLGAEKVVLGACLAEKEAVRSCMHLLQPDDFYLHGHRMLYEVISKLYRAGLPISEIFVLRELDKISGTAAKEVGGQDYLFGLQQDAVVAPMVEPYAKLVKRQSQLRIKTTCCLSWLGSPNLSNEVVLRSAFDESVDGDIIMENVEDIKAEQDQEVDWLIPNFIPGRGAVTVLSGDPGAGKSFFALALCHAFVNRTKFLGKFPLAFHGAAWYIDFDSVKSIWRDRIFELDQGSGVRTPQLDAPVEVEGPWEVEEPENGAAEVPKRRLWASWRTGNVAAGPTIYGLVQGIRRRRIKLIVLDHLLRMIPEMIGFQKDNQAAEAAMRHICRLAQNEEIAVVCLNQNNKGSGQFPTSALQKSFGPVMIAAGADAVVSLQKAKGKGGVREIQLAKIRAAKFPLQDFTWEFAAGEQGGTILTYAGEIEEEVRKEGRRLGDEIKEFVREHLPETEWVLSSDLRTAVELESTDYKDATIKKALKEMVGSGEVILEGHGITSRYRRNPLWEG
jgi:hypothetical protein